MLNDLRRCVVVRGNQVAVPLYNLGSAIIALEHLEQVNMVTSDRSEGRIGAVACLAKEGSFREENKSQEGSAAKEKDCLPCPTDVRQPTLVRSCLTFVAHTVGVVDGSIYRLEAASYQIVRRRRACCSGSASFVLISVNRGLVSMPPRSGCVATRRLKFCTLWQDDKLQKYVHACGCEAAAQAMIAVLLEVVSYPCRRSIRLVRLRCCS